MPYANAPRDSKKNLYSQKMPSRAWKNLGVPLLTVVAVVGVAALAIVMWKAVATERLNAIATVAANVSGRPTEAYDAIRAAAAQFPGAVDRPTTYRIATWKGRMGKVGFARYERNVTINNLNHAMQTVKQVVAASKAGFKHWIYPDPLYARLVAAMLHVMKFMSKAQMEKDDTVWYAHVLIRNGKQTPRWELLSERVLRR